MNIKKQISIINKEIKDKAELIAVSKTRSIEDINEAYKQGQKKFGENRVQEIVDKFNKLPKDIEWHMIGHLQKNKVKYISEFISLIHSLDRLSLANEIDKNGKKHDKSIDCLIQIKISKEESKFGLNIDELDSFYNEVKMFKNINRLSLANEIDKNGKKHDKSIDCLIQIKISKEESKFGLNIDELDSFYNEVKMFKNINIIGLMGMATFTNDKMLINDEFQEMGRLFKKMKAIDSNFKILSIGMSDDYLIGIQNGSNMIRVGSKIFGKRNY